jgi:hypothetical protein
MYYIYTAIVLTLSQLIPTGMIVHVLKVITWLTGEENISPSFFLPPCNSIPVMCIHRTDHNYTLNRLVNLNLFKFVKKPV